ncbi:OmpA family protein [Antarcticirhabdus aurantiaca]|uniref:OmpA family protein n=1 Tax=Antarcticirhabdus aurantiaca TaxID=2606717 RepID=A0ACD4NRC9_9HYPH|nr:OmpA family protein [Antarcticirhabdus aurantiaca]WAJ29261.1 OmpA family protein [Jeongeuplla avenae]
MTKTTTGLICAALSLGLLAGCTTDPYTGEGRLSNTAGGVGIGAGVGALGGYLVGRAAGVDEGNAALIGAGIGALGGGAIGTYMDRQEDALRRTLQGSGVSVTRVGDRIILNMPSNITFPTDGDRILPGFEQTLQAVALVFLEYRDSIINIDGHTDSQGSDSYNLALSQRRAGAVAQYLASRGISGSRLNDRGFGESRPIASNATEAGRAQNRRVEIAISPLRGG